MKSLNKKLILGQFALGACSLLSLEASATTYSQPGFIGAASYAYAQGATDQLVTSWNYQNEGSYLDPGAHPYATGTSSGLPDNSQVLSNAFSGQDQYGQRANATALVNMVTGSLHASVDSVGNTGGHAIAAFTDKVTFHSVNESTRIDIQYTIDGFLSPKSPSVLQFGSTQATLTSQLTLNAATGEWAMDPTANGQVNSGTGFQPVYWWGGISGAPSTVIDTNADPRYSLTQDASGTVTFTYKDYFIYSGTDPYAVAVNMYLDLNCGFNVACDFGNTAKLNFLLPEGVSFESQSQQLLTSVPVPAAVWLFGSGLLGLVGLGRQRKAV